MRREAGNGKRQRETADGRREAGGGRREAHSEKRKAGNGRRETGGVRREAAGDKRETVSEKRKARNGKRETVDGRRETGNGRRETAAVKHRRGRHSNGLSSRAYARDLRRMLLVQIPHTGCAGFGMTAYLFSFLFSRLSPHASRLPSPASRVLKSLGEKHFFQ